MYVAVGWSPVPHKPFRPVQNPQPIKPRAVRPISPEIGGSPEPPPGSPGGGSARTPSIGEAFEASGGDPESAVGPPRLPGEPSTPLGGWGARSSGSGGGLAVPGIIGEGAGALAQGLPPILKRKQTIQQAYDQVDDPSPGADPPQQDRWVPGRGLRGGLFGGG